MNFQIDGVDVPSAAGDKALALVLGLEGNTSGGLAPVQFPIVIPGIYKQLNITGNGTLTLAMMRAGAVLTSTSAASTTLLLPTMATLGFTRPSDGTANLYFDVQRGGLGPLFVNPASGVTIIWNDLDPQYMTQWAPKIRISMVADNVWAAG
jgi:hypothetical protein